MKLTFLGTGAADWDINAYVKGQAHRRFSSALVNNDLLIDPGPHIFHFAKENGTPDMFDNVKNIIVTHTHDDHFNAETVERLCLGKDCILWGDYACRKKLETKLGKAKAAQIKFAETRPRTEYNIGGYAITPLRSNHVTENPDETTRVYLIEQAGRILYYGCDCAWIPTESWNIIKTKPVNTLVMELTCGETAPNDWRIFEHNTLEMLFQMLEMFKKYNCFAPDVKYYTLHMARTLHGSHEDLAKILAPKSVVPAYDGMIIEI